MKLILVEWIDTHAGRGWQSIDDLKDHCTPLSCRSVGWILAKRNGHIVIAPHLSGYDNDDIVTQGRGDLAIPEQMIKKMKVLQR